MPTIWRWTNLRQTWLKCCWSFSFVKLMQNCSKLQSACNTKHFSRKTQAISIWYIHFPSISKYICKKGEQHLLPFPLLTKTRDPLRTNKVNNRLSCENAEIYYSYQAKFHSISLKWSCSLIKQKAYRLSTCLSWNSQTHIYPALQSNTLSQDLVQLNYWSCSQSWKSNKANSESLIKVSMQRKRSVQLPKFWMY